MDTLFFYSSCLFYVSICVIVNKAGKVNDVSGKEFAIY